MMKGLLFMACFGVSVLLIAQVNDSFIDGDFTSNPVWSGTSTFGVNDPFEIVETDNQLRSQNLNMGSGVRQAYLSTPADLDLANAKAEWSFRMKIGFAQPGSSSTNSNNTSRVYLMSSSSDLNADLKGYFVELRYPSTNVNELRLFRQDGGTETELSLSGNIQELTPQSFVEVSVSRSELGVWEVLVNGMTQGTTSDNTYNSSNHFGVQIRYTANSRDDGFYYDDFTTEIIPVADTEPPSVSLVVAGSENEVTVSFSEPMDQETAENGSNYHIDQEIVINQAILDSEDASMVCLNTSSLVNGTTYSITINNVEDQSGNTIQMDSQNSFQYLVFGEVVEFDVVINEFMADPNPVRDNLPDAEYLELYNRSNKFFNTENWVLDGELLPKFTFEPNAFIIIVEDDDEAEFNPFENVISVDRLSLNNSSPDEINIQDENGAIIHSIAFQGSEGGISTELINPNGPDYSADNYGLSLSSTGGTPGEQNSIFNDTPDVIPPSILSVTAKSDSEIEVLFNERVSLTTSENPFNYLIDGDISVTEASADESGKLVRLEVDPITAGQIMTLTVDGIEDLSGNVLNNSSTIFGLPKSPAFNELIITEIMFDPDPQIGLPEQEYIELFNPTSELISTEGCFLRDATNAVSIPSFSLNPHEYYILSTTAGATAFNDKAIGISGFPSLNNTGEQLILSHNEDLIFSINYDPDWHDEEKSAGGYSLEMKDITNPCLENRVNWGSSRDVRGGTPAEPNSISEVIPDNFGPEIVSIVAVTSDSVIVEFDEKVDPAGVMLASAILDPLIPVDDIFFNLNYPFKISIKLTSPLTENIPYSFSLNSVTDCSGNEIRIEEVVFALPVEAESNEVKLSEILFNPRANGVDFVEVYNSTEKYISLKEWKLANMDDDGNLKDIVEISAGELVLRPKTYLVFTVDNNLLLGNYPNGRIENFYEVSSMPSYPNAEGDVVVLNSTDQIIEMMSYDEDMHFDLLADVDGVSLERISFEESASAKDNWRSASSTENFATPGYLNSQSLDGEVSSGTLNIFPQVFIPGDYGSGRDFTTINYQLDEPGKFANVTIYDQSGRLVKNVVQGASLATKGFFRWDGDTNDGKITRMGYHLIVFEIYDSSGNTEIIKETIVVGRDF